MHSIMRFLIQTQQRKYLKTHHVLNLNLNNMSPESQNSYKTLKNREL